MAMSHCLMSASEIGLPSFELWACALPALNESARMRAASVLCIDMLDLPLAVDAPARDAVVMLIGEDQRGRYRITGFAPRCHKRRAKWLHVAGLIPGAAL